MLLLSPMDFWSRRSPDLELTSSSTSVGNSTYSKLLYGSKYIVVKVF